MPYRSDNSARDLACNQPTELGDWAATIIAWVVVMGTVMALVCVLLNRV